MLLSFHATYQPLSTHPEVRPPPRVEQECHDLSDQHPPIHAGGHLRAAETQLPRLKALGVVIIWLMPVHPTGEVNRKGTLGSPYSVKDYYGVNPEFGTLEDLKQFVHSAHELGMYVILDWVANHSAWDCDLDDDAPGVVRTRLEGRLPADAVVDWPDIIDFDYNRRYPPLHDRGDVPLGARGWR